jgi:hypothetical protein
VQTPVVQCEASANSAAVALHFPFGLLGFPEVTEYILSDVAPDLPFKCLGDFRERYYSARVSVLR